jgi:hypothetical protein
LIVYTLTNTITEQVFVGTTTDSATERWKQIQAALPLGFEGKIYKEIRDLGADSFVLNDFAVAYDRAEMKELFIEAMETHNGISLQGLKTKEIKVAKVTELKTVGVRTSSTSKLNTKPTVKRAAPKEKISTGRVNSAAKERAIKEAIAEEKAQRAMIAQQKAMAEADEMKAIMAKLDGRAAAAKRR